MSNETTFSLLQQSLIEMKVASKPSNMGYYSTKAGLGKVGQAD
jgi:hypothetical protein